MNNPLLSVIYPNYNHSHFFASSLTAICKQTYPNFEVIVIDDKSTDKSLKVLEEYQKKYKNIRLYENSQNMGPEKTVNYGITKARGDYLAFCAADDRIYPGFFSESMEFLIAHPDAAFCITDPSFFYNDGNKSFIQNLFPSKDRIVITPDRVVSLYKYSKFWIPSHSTIYKRDSVIKYGKYDDKFKWHCDVILNLMISFNEKILYIPKVFASMRIVPNSYSHNKSYKKSKEIYENILIEIGKQPCTIQKMINKSGVLTVFGSKMILFLLSKIKNWKYIPSFVFKKFINIFFKIKQNLKKQPFEKVIQNK